MSMKFYENAKGIPTKYGNKICYDSLGNKFDSQGEMNRWAELKLMERGGLINKLQRQVPFVIIPKSKYGGDIKYVADFVYIDAESGEPVVEDFKGVRTQLYQLKRRLMAERYNIIIKESK